MIKEKGTISINTENIFPIIKKFLYSDHAIFLRELVSNAIDATQKIKRLSSLGQYNKELGELTVQVKVNKKKKTITISDAGLGMTAEELKKYINQVAFSGATEFMELEPIMSDENIALAMSTPITALTTCAAEYEIKCPKVHFFSNHEVSDTTGL